MDKKRSAQEADIATESALRHALFGAYENVAFGKEFADDRSDDSEDESGAADASSSAADAAAKPAWFDPEDEQVRINLAASAPRNKKLRKTASESVVTGEEYTKRLREQYDSIGTRDTTWADLSTAQKENQAREKTLSSLLQSASSLVTRDRKLLPERVLAIQRVRDPSKDSEASAAIHSVDWHPTFPSVLLAGSYDTSLRLYSADGIKNPVLASVYVPKLPITCARFFPSDGSEAIIGGHRPFFYTYDVHSAKLTRVLGIVGRECKTFGSFVLSSQDVIAFMQGTGVTSLVSRKTKHWIADLKMNGSVAAATFSRDGTSLYSIGSEGAVYIWDVRMNRCRHRFQDEGCIHGSSIALSEDGQWLATGSNSGVVNVYRTADAQASTSPKPQKSIMNLTTQIDNLSFHPEGQILLASSRAKKDQLRAIHLPSMSVFANFPDQKQHALRHVHTHSFSSSGGFLSIGNDKGMVQLYRLKHYNKM
jgi:U3 small nucleolar RNA-associated protein 18